MRLNAPQSIRTGILSGCLVLLIWMFLAPTQLGGHVTYVIVSGNSMEPRFHLGDLLLVRRQASYAIGDAVTYSNAELGSFVFHRIIDYDLDGFILKGDNNNWLDSYHPDQAEIIGKLWFHIPFVGRAIEWVRLPIHLALTFGLLGGLLMTNMMMQPNPRGKMKNSIPARPGGIHESALYISGFLAVGFLLLGIFAFTRPLTRPADDIAYQQDGQFFYSATGTPGIYDSSTVQPGEPIFPSLTCFLNIGFTYQIAAGQLQQSAGTHQLSARMLHEQSGWQRTLPLTQATAFSGNSFFNIAALDLCQVEALVDVMEQETGLHSSTYILEILPQVEVAGRIAGEPITDTFAPKLVFHFDKVHFYLARGGTMPGADVLLHVTQRSQAPSSALQANTLPIFGWSPTVQFTRALSMIGLGVSLAGAIIIAWSFWNIAQQGQNALIRMKYGGLLMDVYERNFQPSPPILDVTSMADLAKLAERHNTLILHMADNFMDCYLVQADGVTYRYVIRPDVREAVYSVPLLLPEPLQAAVRSAEFEDDKAVLSPIEAGQDEVFGYTIQTEGENVARAETLETQFLRKVRL